MRERENQSENEKKNERMRTTFVDVAEMISESLVGTGKHPC